MADERTDAELIAALQAKQAELERLRAEAQKPPAAQPSVVDKWDLSSIDTSRVRKIAMWVPPMGALWGSGYLSDFDFVVGLSLLALTALFAIYAEAVKFTRTKLQEERQQQEEAEARAAAKRAPAAVVRSAKKKGSSSTESEQAEEEWDPGLITWKTWLPPFLVLWIMRGRMTDRQFLGYLILMIGMLKLGQYLVRRFEKTRFRQRLRAASKARQKADEKEKKEKEKEKNK